MAKTIEQFRTEAAAEVESEKPLFGQDSEKGRYEYTDSDYEQIIEDRAQFKFDQQENGYKTARREAYPELPEQFDLIWHAIDQDKLDKTSDFYKDLKKVKDDNPKPE
jgi:hypothetical protein